MIGNNKNKFLRSQFWYPTAIGALLGGSGLHMLLELTDGDTQFAWLTGGGVGAIFFAFLYIFANRNHL